MSMFESQALVSIALLSSKETVFVLTGQSGGLYRSAQGYEVGLLKSNQIYKAQTVTQYSTGGCDPMQGCTSCL